MLLEEGWIKSSYSAGGGSCVEFRPLNGHVQFRDSKLKDFSPVVTTSPQSWKEFTAFVGRAVI